MRDIPIGKDDTGGFAVWVSYREWLYRGRMPGHLLKAKQNKKTENALAVEGVQDEIPLSPTEVINE